LTLPLFDVSRTYVWNWFERKDDLYRDWLNATINARQTAMLISLSLPADGTFSFPYTHSNVPIIASESQLSMDSERQAMVLAIEPHDGAVLWNAAIHEPGASCKETWVVKALP
jgi:hypothetical protein